MCWKQCGGRGYGRALRLASTTAVYDQVLSSDFSRHVLSVEISRLLVLRVRDLGWSDLGHPGRVLAVLEKNNSKPRWMKAWKQAKRAAVDASPEANPVVA
jgi:hypothetical protein